MGNIRSPAKSRRKSSRWPATQGLSRAVQRRLRPWQPLAIYSRAPFARITSQVASSTTQPASGLRRDFTTMSPANGSSGVARRRHVAHGTWDPALGRTYVQIAREGWGEQKSQYGGANPTLSQPETRAIICGPSRLPPPAKEAPAMASLFENHKVNIDTGLAGLAAWQKRATLMAAQWLAEIR